MHIHIRTWPTRVLMRVFRSLLSLCSVTRICCLIISADVIGRLGLPSGGTVNGIDGDAPALVDPGDDGFDPPPEPDTILLEGDRLIIFNPRARLTRLFGVVTTCPLGFDPGPLPPLSP
ncbi:hypothetical protein TorRG33x02_093310 [Trema orientale]|uniref:Uncharacterized protein n=1 Tax=Trema orientale TaxID=63057 RepID=A0A2P5FAK4_TREOI|nr:hypothetical protein TorRG33x02_093310 [Trema orientale]